MGEAGKTPVTRILVRGERATEQRIQVYRLRIRSNVLSINVQKKLEVRQPVFRIGSREGNDLTLADDTISRIHCEIRAEDLGFRIRDLGSSNGTTIDGFRVIDAYLRPSSVIGLGRIELVFEPLEEEESVVLSPEDRFGFLIGRSVVMRRLFSLMERLAGADCPMLIQGESGSGKTLAAESIHQKSRRADGPFVSFDFAAYRAEDVEAALQTAIEEAEGGTLVIDDIGEIPVTLQPKLLRLASGESKTRMIGLTQRDLAGEVNRGGFREDLYYRLAIGIAEIPPLRTRPDDIRLLVEHFVKTSPNIDEERATEILRSISVESWKGLENYPWRGNVRELKNVVWRTLMLGESSATQEMTAIAKSPTSSAGVVNLERPFMEHKAEVIAQFEGAYLTGMIDKFEGNMTRAAASAGLDRMYFKRLLRKYRA